jgi:hypothetical protein
VLSGIVSAGLGALGIPVEEQDWLRDVLADRRTVLLLMPWIVLVGPVAEEVFFRGYAFRFIRQEAGFPTGLLVSSVLFAVIHLNVSGFLVYLVIGSVLAWVHERAASLLAPIAGHVTINAVVVLYSLLASPLEA